MSAPWHRLAILLRIMEKARNAGGRVHRARSLRRIKAHTSSLNRWRRAQCRYLGRNDPIPWDVGTMLAARRIAKDPKRDRYED